MFNASYFGLLLLSALSKTKSHLVQSGPFSLAEFVASVQFVTRVKPARVSTYICKSFSLKILMCVRLCMCNYVFRVDQSKQAQLSTQLGEVYFINEPASVALILRGEIDRVIKKHSLKFTRQILLDISNGV